ncbi:MAG: aminomethyl-transferring glycine dehydrogenase subunit GcvPA [Burkholderiales bacterium]
MESWSDPEPADYSMPFIPHTQDDIRAMCREIGVPDLETLFDEIPSTLKSSVMAAVPAGIGEMAVGRLMRERARRDPLYLNFIGAGAYEHHIPSAVWQIATRGEFYSAYTPYQAEASQGTLQLLYEFQSMITSLLALDVANASLYDGASALADAVLMAVRAHKDARIVLMPRSVHPRYRKVVKSIVSHQQIGVKEIDFSLDSGRVDMQWLEREGKDKFAALVIPQPNYFGNLEDVNPLVDWAHSRGALAIGCVNPTALGLLKPPGQWGSNGADIAVGEGQPLGVPLANGGPYFGFMACKQALVRQMPGRIVGATVDTEGRRGFTLTLQAREQHIRRSRATSNICTNQGLAVTAATIYLAMLGPQGLRNVATRCHANLSSLLECLHNISGIERVFNAPVFHEAAVRLPHAVPDALESMREQSILGGYDLSSDYPELGNALLVCATETKTAEDLQTCSEAFALALKH